jgi:uncharacterized protein
MAKLVSRWQTATVNTLTKERRVLLLAGPRQCGKTTLVRQLVADDVEYRTLDDSTLKEAAEADPGGFAQHHKKMLIIDEIQRVPALLPAIKKIVDENDRPGQFLLTGSANILSMPDVQESLAGRISRIRLRTFSTGELAGVAPDFLRRCFAQNFNSKRKSRNRDEVIETAMRGGFPEALTLDGRARARWHRDYIEALLARDLMDISKIRQQDAMRELVRILAAWSSKFMDVSKIGAGLSIQRPTLESYINAVESLFIVERVSPWTKTDYDRVGKQKKLYMSDSGLMSSILGWKEDDLRFDSDRVGKLVETYAYHELAVQIDLSDGEYALYHYRDREQREIDFLVERADGALLGIEIKAATTVTKDDFKHMMWFQGNIARDSLFTGVILYTGDKVASFGENLWALPFNIL